MTYLAELQLRLNKDVRLRAEFLKDPVAMLERGGVTLTDDAKADLMELISKVRNPKSRGAAERGERRAISIGIRGVE